MVACIDFFEMSEICRPKFIVRHSTYLEMSFLTWLMNVCNLIVEKAAIIIGICNN
jgi:hypothetical protein